MALTVGKLGPWIRQGSGKGSTSGLRKQTPGLGEADKQGQWATEVCEIPLKSRYVSEKMGGDCGTPQVWLVNGAEKNGGRRVVCLCSKSIRQAALYTRTSFPPSTALPRTGRAVRPSTAVSWDAARSVLQRGHQASQELRTYLTLQGQ